MTAISAVIITFNEALNIGRCLRSVSSLVDEIVVVDSHSTDGTIDICNSYGARIIQCDWQGYAHAKNTGNTAATHNYILSIDADEALSPALSEAIRSVKPSLQGAYSFNRLTRYCGKWVRHCGWYPDVKRRLFNRNDLRWEGDFVHESLVAVNAVKTTHLNGDLLHYSFYSLSDHLQRVDRYSQLAARELHTDGKQAGFLKLWFGPPAKFLKVFFLKQGYHDGFYGFCIASISAFDVFVRYAKLRDMNRRRIGEDEAVSELPHEPLLRQPSRRP